MAESGKVDADLVSAAGQQVNLEQRICGARGPDLVLRQGALPICAHLPVIRLARVAANGHVNTSFPPVQMAGHQCQILAVDLAVMLRHRVLDARRFRENDNARRITVKTVERMDADRFSSAPEITGHRMDERVARFAMRRMDDHRGRLVDDQEGLVLIEYIERQVDWHDGRRFLPEHRQLIPCPDAQAGITTRLPVDKNCAIPLDVLPELHRKPERRHGELAYCPAIMGSIYSIGKSQK